MNKEEKDVIDFLKVSAITKIEKTILSKGDVKCLLNCINKYKKRIKFLRIENAELKDELDYYKEIEADEFDERDRWE